MYKNFHSMMSYQEILLQSSFWEKIRDPFVSSRFLHSVVYFIEMHLLVLVHSI